MAEIGRSDRKDKITYRKARKDAVRELAACGVPDADVDAELLMEYASSQSRTGLMLREKEEIPEAVLSSYLEAVSLRKRRIPLQQITGKAYFMGLELTVSDKVLTPRQDTETLAEEAVKRIRERQKAGGQVRVLDLCTGSGCLILAAARFCPGIEAVGTDLSGDALYIARINAQRLNEDIFLLKSDLFDKVKGQFDVIMSNPPYIRSGDMASLMEEVKDHEPHLALDGGQDGLHYYREIARRAGAFLKEGAWLLFEIGADQGRNVTEILEMNGYSDLSLIRDLSGHDRVVCGRKGGSLVSES